MVAGLLNALFERGIMSATNRGSARAVDDFYETPRGAVLSLLPKVPRGFIIFDAGCGSGAARRPRRMLQSPLPDGPYDGAGVAKLVNAADFNWSARGEIPGVEPLKVGERHGLVPAANPEPSPLPAGRCRDWTGGA